MNSPGLTWYSPLADGRLLGVHASLRPRHGRASLKVQFPATTNTSQHHLLEQRLRWIVHLARLNEQQPVSHDQQLLLEFDQFPNPAERDWELAVVMADRSVRGLYSPPAGQLLAIGHATDWAKGNLLCDAATLKLLPNFMARKQLQHWVLPTAAASLIAPLPAAAPPATLQFSAQLATLCAQAAPGRLLVQQTCWFPLLGADSPQSGNPPARLGKIDLWLRAQAADRDGDSTKLVICGLDAPAQHQAQEVIQEARASESRAVLEWRGLASFGLADTAGADSPGQQDNMVQMDHPTPPNMVGMVGNSWQLALVLADRIARGMAFPAQGRVIASGCSTRWHSAEIESVAGAAQKCALLLEQALPGDRIILPRAWETEIPAVLADFLPRLAAKGASCVFPARLALW